MCDENEIGTWIPLLTLNTHRGLQSDSGIRCSTGQNFQAPKNYDQISDTYFELTCVRILHVYFKRLCNDTPNDLTLPLTLGHCYT